MLSIYPGVCRIYNLCRAFHLGYHIMSVHPPALLQDILAGRDLARLEMHLEAEIEWTERYTPRLWSSEFGDAVGDRGWVNSELHLEAVIVWVCRHTWRPRLSELRCAHPGRDRVSLEMHLEQAMIKRDWRSTSRRSIWGEARRQVTLNSLVNL